MVCGRRHCRGRPLDTWRIVIAWAAFAVFHSLTVSEGYERLARRAMGDRAYSAWHRLLFTAYSGAAFLLVVLYIRSVPDLPLYRVSGIVRVLFHAVQACGALLLLWTPWDLQEFVGIRQWRRRRDPTPPEPGRSGRLFTGRAYGVVRHPLYLGISVILLFNPVHTRNSLVSTGMVLLYFYVGTFFEERRLARAFGEAYRDYQARVPRLLPLGFLRTFLARKESGPP